MTERHYAHLAPSYIGETVRMARARAVKASVAGLPSAAAASHIRPVVEHGAIGAMLRETLTGARVLIVVSVVLSAANAFAQSLDCGKPPELPFKSEETENLKGDLEGKAQLLSKFVGGGNLKGQAAAERKTIYQNANSVLAAWQAGYLSYIFCASVMQDKSLSTEKKIDAWRQFQEAMQPPRSDARGPTLQATRESIIDATGATIPGDLPYQFARADDNSVISMRGVVVTPNSVSPGNPAPQSFPPPTGEYSSFSIDQLNGLVKTLAEEMRQLQQHCDYDLHQFWRSKNWHSEEEKRSGFKSIILPYTTEYQTKLAPAALSLASEYMARLGQVTPPATASWGAQMLIYQKFAGSPARDVAIFLDYLRDESSLRQSQPH